MNNIEKIEIIADVLNVNAAALTPSIMLDTLPEWDSVSALSFLLMLAEDFGKHEKGENIRRLQTIGDMMKIMRR